MIQINRSNNKEILEYIGNDYYKCLYLYLDLIKYPDSENVKSWLQYSEDGSISAVCLMYFSGMHFFSKNNKCDFNELVDLVLNECPSVICAEKWIIESLAKLLTDYSSEYGYVRELDKLNDFHEYNDVVEAYTEQDFKQISDLLMQDDDIGSSYSNNELFEQIKQRNEEKYGRNYMIKSDDTIVCHAGTGAENEKVAMLNYVITHPDFRSKGLAYKTVSKVCSDLIAEGKKVYLINYSQESTKLYDKIGFKVSCEWGKLFPMNGKDE